MNQSKTSLSLFLCSSPDQFLPIKLLAICFSSCVWTCHSRSWSWCTAYGVTGNSRGPNTRICHVDLMWDVLVCFCFGHLLPLGMVWLMICYHSHLWSEIDGWSKFIKYRMWLKTYRGAYLDSICEQMGMFACLTIPFNVQKCFFEKQIWLGFEKQLYYSKYIKYGESGINLLYAIVY